MIDCSGLEYGTRYDLLMKSGQIYKGWYLYNSECGYFSKEQGSQLKGFVYSEDIKSVSKSK